MPTHILVDTDSTQNVENKNLTDCTLTSAILGGTMTGTYTLGGTPTISGPTISGPTVTGILTVAGHIKFPGTQNPSGDVNTLDDYEEGNWTPAIGGTATYTIQLGRYTKLGRVVHVFGQLTINTLGTGSTSVISGLPFACTADFSCPIHIGSFASIGASVVGLYGRVDTGASTITLFGATAAAVNNSATSTIFANSAAVNFSATYYI